MNDSKSPILCIGLTPALQRTLHMSDIRLGEVNRATRQLLSPSGKACNVARTLKHLNRNAIILGLNGGTSGQELERQLDREGLAHDFVVVEQATRTCTTLIDSVSGKITELVEEASWPGDNAASSLLASVQQHAESVSAAVIAGNLPPHAEPDIYASIIKLLHTFNVPVFIDTSGPAFLSALDAAPHFIKMNHHEQVKTQNVSAEAFAAQVHNKGVKALLITNGKHDALLFEPTSRTQFTPPAIKEINNIGSGDATTAGIAHAWLNGAGMRDAVRFGLACGTANALTETPGEIDGAQAEDFRARMAVQ